MSNIVRLPELEDMRDRLESAANSPYEKERLHPLILKHAGEALSAEDIVIMLEAAVLEYSKNLDQGAKLLFGLMQDFLPDYIEALIDDIDVAAEAKSLLETLNS